MRDRRISEISALTQPKKTNATQPIHALKLDVWFRPVQFDRHLPSISLPNFLLKPSPQPWIISDAAMPLPFNRLKK